MQDTMGQAGYGMFFMFGSFDLLMFVFVYFFVPETKGLSLEQMDELFGVVDPAAASKAADNDVDDEHVAHVETIRQARAKA